MRRRLLMAMTATMLVGTLGVAPASAAEEMSGSSSEASALEVEGVAVISRSEAREGEASSTGLELFGEQVTGTSQEGEGTSEDALFDSERDAGVPSDQAHVQVGASSSTVHEDGSSEAHSDLVVVDLGNGSLRAELFSSDANSDGSAQSDGVRLTSSQDPTGEGITVLHSEVSGGEGSAAVAIIGGEGIITDEQTGGLCAMEIEGVIGADIVCVQATEAGGVSSGVVDDVQAGGEPVAGIVTSESAPSTPGTDTEVLGQTITQPSTPSGLPRTGMDLMALAIVALGAAGTGDQLRRRAATAA